MWPWAPPSGPSAGMSSPGALARLEALRSECEWKPLPSSLLRTSFVRSIDGPGLPQRRFRGARESAVDAELANGSARFDRAANLAAGRCDGIRFTEGEAWTSVAFNTAPAAAGRQHSTWVAAVAFDA